MQQRREQNEKKIANRTSGNYNLAWSVKIDVLLRNTIRKAKKTEEFNELVRKNVLPVTEKRKNIYRPHNSYTSIDKKNVKISFV